MVVAVGRDDAIFGAPREMGDRRPGQPLRKVGGKGAPQIGAEGADRDEPLPLEKGREAAHGGFDFGKLGHFAPAVSGICARGKARLKALLKQAFPAKARTR